MTASPTLVWLRDDLRLADNPALRWAVDRGDPVVVAYVLDEESPEARPLGGASRWWLHHSLASLRESLDARGSALVLRRGAAETVVPELVAALGADAVVWNRRYGPSREIDVRLKSRLRDEGIEATSLAGNLLVEPWRVLTDSGTPFRVFTPFWRAAQRADVRDLVPEPRIIETPAFALRVSVSEDLDDWGLLPTRPDWAGGLREEWEPGEGGALRRLDAFIAEALSDYDQRDRPGLEVTSKLSPHLRFGEISSTQIWHRVHRDADGDARTNVAKYLSEVGWREFNWNILFHFPELASRNFRPEFDAFPWREPEPGEIEAWQQGRTGIPLVDAGMRELWRTGYMHNRVRMVTASLLVKNLLVDWRIGERWFWDTLVDADEANNPGNWQWVAGSGADAAPYFRVFNPELQRAKFDPDDAYVRRWVPELGTADYPEPVVDLGETRREALDAYEAVKAAR